MATDNIALPAAEAAQSATPDDLAARSWVRLRALAPVLLILAFSFLFRSQHFGSPDIDYDEPFYLLVGDRMVQGATVYVDIWDRKPIGLFLIYALARLPGGDGFLAYQLLASAFAAGTALFIWLMAQRMANRWVALLPALLYLIWQEPYYGGGGQSAIFYNLLTAASFWLLLRATGDQTIRGVALLGAAAMLLMGCAIQIKYTVLPEGVFLGLSFLFLLFRRRMPLSTTAAVAIGYGALALVPTAAVALYYLAIGQFSAFLFANFTSIFARLPLENEYVQDNLRYILLVSLPLIGCALLGLSRVKRENADTPVLYPLLACWLAAATLGFVMISNFYWYYFMPMLLPLALLCAPLFRRWDTALPVALLLIVWPLHISGYWAAQARDGRIASMNELTRLVTPHLQGRCLFIFDGPASLYLTANACIPTKFAYPDHLSNDVERPALGVDAAAEMQRILASRPGAIVTSPDKVVPVRNAATSRLLEEALHRDYRRVGTVIHKGRRIEVFGLRPTPGAKRSS